MGHPTPARDYYPGMGQAVADRTINRKTPTGTETWADVSARVALGNSLLEPRPLFRASERHNMEHHLRQASLLMSGRHLQHGDETQPTRNMEVFSNCSTAATTFLNFYLLLNGSGVGRCYDDAMIRSDLNKMPVVICTIDWGHKDVEGGLIQGYMRKHDAMHLYEGRKITIFDVPDTREGWAKAIEALERMAFEERRDEVLIIDFTGVRPRGEPIMGMQGRPASGPGPLMGAIANLARLRDAGMEPWRAAMYADHYAAECVLVGGARRSARMSTKIWSDPSIFEFITLKQGGFLWSSNNSVTVDEEFRVAVRKVYTLLRKMRIDGQDTEQHIEELRRRRKITKTEAHAFNVMFALTNAAYHHGGEPGLINVDRLTQSNEGIEEYLDGCYADGAKFEPDRETLPLMRALAAAAWEQHYSVITNPCGEIVLLALGGYCVIADVVPFHAGERHKYTCPKEDCAWGGLWDIDAEDAFRTATRALIRTNLMDCIYKREVARTNRIGVGMTGFHEWVYARFGYTWRDIINENKSIDMWRTVSRFKRAVDDESISYSAALGVVAPHTTTTFKPAGTTSKLFGLTEGAHLPSMREFIRWVQFRGDDPLVAVYKAKGYPVKHLKTYEGTTIVGFPTKPAICLLDGGDWVVTAPEATPEEQYKFLRLLDKYWLTGVAEDGVSSLPERGNQVSYTLKFDPKKVGFSDFFDYMIEGQFSVRCCTVMPQTDTSAYEYTPEQATTKHEFEMIAAAIKHDDDTKEDIGQEHVECAGGSCPISFNENNAKAVA